MKCPYCGTTKGHVSGYGFAAGPLGGYTLCGNVECGKVIDFSIDLDAAYDEESKGALLAIQEKFDLEIEAARGAK